jgi:hypothetical protein
MEDGIFVTVSGSTLHRVTVPRKEFARMVVTDWLEGGSERKWEERDSVWTPTTDDMHHGIARSGDDGRSACSSGTPFVRLRVFKSRLFALQWDTTPANRHLNQRGWEFFYRRNAHHDTPLVNVDLNQNTSVDQVTGKIVV